MNDSQRGFGARHGLSVRRLKVGVAVWAAVVALLALPFMTVAGVGIFQPHPTTPEFFSGDDTEVALGDLDDDGDLDAVFATLGGPESVWLNGGAGNFSIHPKTPYFGYAVHSASGWGLALGDLDDDGDLDAVVANVAIESKVWVNDGFGNFTAHPTTPSLGADGSYSVALGDLDDDGDLDAVFANGSYSSANSQGAETVWLNDGAGNLSRHPVQPSFGTLESYAVELGDLDDDGDLDAVFANGYLRAPETVWVNDGTGNFSAHPTTPTFGGRDSHDVGLGDLDGDGDLDAVIANEGLQYETVWVNNGAGSFTPHPTRSYFGGEGSYEVELADLDGDGDLDAVVANRGNPGDAETVWLNLGTGHFISHPISPSFGGQASYDVTLGDLDNDGDPDAVVANWATESETVWLNSDPASAQIAGFAASASGDSVRVTWETVSEQGNQGFNLLRGTSAEAPEQQLNETLIASEAPNSSEGYSYEWVDTQVQAGTTYYYWLETVDTSGSVNRTGPVSATYEAPTALTLGGLSASTRSVLPWWAVAAGLAVATIGLRFQRRRG